MLKDRGKPMRLSKEFDDFIENLRATRRSKVCGTDKQLLTKMETCDVLVKYFKLNQDRFLEITKLQGAKNV